LLEDLQMMLEYCPADFLDCCSTANKDVKMLIIVYEESANNLLKRKRDLWDSNKGTDESWKHKKIEYCNS
jgi:hypothetical protein